MKRALLLLLLACVPACSRQAQEQAARIKVLEARVATLETQTVAMHQQLQQARQKLDADTRAAADPAKVTLRAAAQYCAGQLASRLEEYRQDNARYPAMSAALLPSACQGFRVSWLALEKKEYHFQVYGAISGQADELLADGTP